MPCRAIIAENDGIDVVTSKTSSRFSSLTGMFSPTSVAVLGASAEPARIGGRPIDLMRKQGFAGTIYPVNPRRDEVQGLRCYPSVADLPAVPDVAIVAVAAEIAVDAVADLAARGVKNVVMLSAGFAEVDDAGAAAQDRMVGIARAAGMRLLGPNCLGLFNARLAFYATFSAAFDSGWPIPGRIGSAPTEVPQAITSPGSKVISRDSRLTMRAGGRIMSASG